MLEQNLTVVQVAGPVDYRTVATADGRFAAGRFVRASGTEPPALSERVALTVGTRTVTASAVRDRTVWFEFAVLCGTPTAPADYLELSERFGCWVITGVPRLREVGAETVRDMASERTASTASRASVKDRGAARARLRASCARYEPCSSAMKPANSPCTVATWTSSAA